MGGDRPDAARAARPGAAVRLNFGRYMRGGRRASAATATANEGSTLKLHVLPPMWNGRGPPAVCSLHPMRWQPRPSCRRRTSGAPRPSRSDPAWRVGPACGRSRNPGVGQASGFPARADPGRTERPDRRRPTARRRASRYVATPAGGVGASRRRPLEATRASAGRRLAGQLKPATNYSSFRSDHPRQEEAVNPSPSRWNKGSAH